MEFLFPSDWHCLSNCVCNVDSSVVGIEPGASGVLCETQALDYQVNPQSKIFLIYNIVLKSFSSFPFSLLN